MSVNVLSNNSNISSSKVFELGTMYWQNLKHSYKELEEDIIKIKDNNFSIIRTFIWWEQLERNEGVYDFTPHDMLFEITEKHGLKVMESLGLYLPLWLIKKLHNHGIHNAKTRYWCLDYPEIQEPLGKYIDAIVNRYKDTSSLSMWNLWNEPGKTLCHCPHTHKKFITWVKEKYKTDEELKAAWCGEYQVLDHILPNSIDELDEEWLSDVFKFANISSKGRITPIEYDYYKFNSFNLAENMKWIHDRVKAIDPNHQTHSNPDSNINNYSVKKGQNEYLLGQTLDSISSSIHPVHHFYQCSEDPNEFYNLISLAYDKTRCWANGKDAWVGEMQAGTVFHHDNTYTPDVNDINHYIWTAVGKGLKGILFWEWQCWRSSIKEIAEFGLRECATGKPTERSIAVKNCGDILKNIGDVLAQAQRPRAQVAIFTSFNTSIYKQLQDETRSGFLNDHAYAVLGIYKALKNANILVDFVDESAILKGRLSQYKAFYAPHVELMQCEVAGKIKEYVAGGGYLWSDARFSFLDEHVYLRSGENPGHGLSEVFGCVEKDFIAARKNVEISFAENTNKLQGYKFQQFLKPTSGTTKARFSNNEPAIIRNKFKNGMAELVGTYLALGLKQNYNNETATYITGFAQEAGVEPTVQISSGFDASYLTGVDYDIIIVTSRPDVSGNAQITPPAEYRTVECPMGECCYDGNKIEREFNEFETAVFVCKK